MSESRKPLYPNPFYVLLVMASTAFAITVFAWLMAPLIQQKAAKPGGPGAGSLALANWVDRNSIMLLTVELVVIVGAGFLAMASDRWFSRDKAKDNEGVTK